MYLVIFQHFVRKRESHTYLCLQEKRLEELAKLKDPHHVCTLSYPLAKKTKRLKRSIRKLRLKSEKKTNFYNYFFFELGIKSSSFSAAASFAAFSAAFFASISASLAAFAAFSSSVNASS